MSALDIVERKKDSGGGYARILSGGDREGFWGLETEKDSGETRILGGYARAARILSGGD